MVRCCRLECLRGVATDRGGTSLLLVVPDVGLLGLLGASRCTDALEEAALEYGAGDDAQHALTVFNHAQRPIVMALTHGRPAASVIGIDASSGLWIVLIRVLLLRSYIQEGLPSTMRLVSITTQIKGSMCCCRR